MILKRLVCKNFRQYRSLDHSFPLAGSIAIIGENEAGKSTIQEMMGYALFGSKVFRTNMDNVLSFKAKSDDECSVHLEFILNDKTYIVDRAFKGKNTTVHFEEVGVKDSICNGANAVDKEINKLFGGIGWDTFNKTYYVKQNELSVLSEMTASERKKFVLKMLHIDSIDKVLEGIRADVKTFKTELAVVDDSIDIEELDKNIKFFNEEINLFNRLIKEREDEIQIHRDNRKSMQSDQEVKAKALNDINSKISNIELQLKNLNQNLEDKKEEKSKITKEIKEITELSKDRKDLEKLEEEYDRLKKLFNEKEQIDKNKVAFKKLKEKKIEYEDKLKQFENASNHYKSELDELKITMTVEEIDVLEGKLEKAKEKRAGYKADIKTKEAEIQKYNQCIDIINKSDDGMVKCPMCGSDISDKKHFEKEIKEAQKLIDEYNQKADELNGVIEKASKTVSNNRAKINNAHQLDIRIKSVKEQIDNCKVLISDNDKAIKSMNDEIPEYDIDVDKKQLDDLKIQIDNEKEITVKLKRGPELAKSFKDVKAKIEEIEVKIEETDKSRPDIKDIDKLNESISTNKKNMGMIEDDIDELRESNDKIKLDKARKERDIKNAVDILEKTKANKEKYKTTEENLLKYNKLLNYFNEFKMQMVAQITPRLSEILSSFVASSTSNRYNLTELDNDYNILVDVDGMMKPIEILSGGATDLLNACLRFSISRYLNESTGSFMRMMFLDEIFGSQSDTRRPSLLSVIDTLKTVYSQIFIITHVKDVIDYVDHVIYVEEDSVKGSYLR